MTSPDTPRSPTEAIESLFVAIRERRRKTLLTALKTGRVAVAAYVTNRVVGRKTTELLALGKSHYTDADIKLAHHQCHRLFRLQDKLWARME